MYFRHVLPVNRTVSEFVPNSCRRVSRVTTTGDRTDFPKSKMANVSPSPCSSTFEFELRFNDYDDSRGWWINDIPNNVFKFSCEKNRSYFLYFISIFFKLDNTRGENLEKIIICKFYNFHYKIDVKIDWLIDKWYMIRNYAFQSHHTSNRMKSRWNTTRHR